MSEFLSKELASLTPYVPGEQPHTNPHARKMIKLNTNESPFMPSVVAAAAGQAAIYRVNMYCDPNADALKEAIAEKAGVSKECVTVGNGSDECLAFIFRGLCGDGAIINDVTYGFYKVLASLFGVKTEVVPVKDDFSIDIKDYAGKKGTIFIANPNTPTGMTIPVSDIKKLLGADGGRLVVVDEAYVDFGGDSAVSLLAKYKNLIVVRTFSKSYALAGARLGYTLSSPEIAADIERIRNSFNPYNVNGITQKMGIFALKDEEFFRTTRDDIVRSRAFLAGELKKMGFKLTDSKANFLFVSPPDGDGENLYERLKKKRILVRYFDEPRLKGYCRITVGSREQCEKLIAAIKVIYFGSQKCAKRK